MGSTPPRCPKLRYVMRTQEKRRESYQTSSSGFALFTFTQQQACGIGTPSAVITTQPFVADAFQLNNPSIRYVGLLLFRHFARRQLSSFAWSNQQTPFSNRQADRAASPQTKVPATEQTTQWHRL